MMNKYTWTALLGVGLLTFGGCRVFESKPMHEAPPPPQSGGGQMGAAGGQPRAFEPGGGGRAEREGANHGGRSMEPTPYGGGPNAGAQRAPGANEGGPAPAPGAGGMGRPLGASSPSGGAGQAASGSQYTIKKGDTLWSIARDHYGEGNRWQDIAQANPGLNPKRLIVGQTITLP